MIKKITVKIFFFLMLSFTLAGCSLIGVKTSGTPTGSMEYVKGTVVSGFPALPLYPKAKAVESYGYKGSYGASFISGDSLAKVINFYNVSFGSLGWEAKLSKQSETNYAFEVKNSENIGSVIINTASDNKQTAITIFVEPQ